MKIPGLGSPPAILIISRKVISILLALGGIPGQLQYTTLVRPARPPAGFNRSLKINQPLGLLGGLVAPVKLQLQLLSCHHGRTRTSIPPLLHTTTTTTSPLAPTATLTSRPVPRIRRRGRRRVFFHFRLTAVCRGKRDGHRYHDTS